MEEQKEKVQVKAVEDTPVSPTTAQDREKAVLEKAVEQGDVKPDFGLQDDGVFKVNLDKENKKDCGGTINPVKKIRKLKAKKKY